MSNLTPVGGSELGLSGETDPFQYTFTVFTATHDSARTLRRVRKSLCRQTFPSFEWLVVDDGSSDETCELVESWAGDSTFPIRLIRQANRGKHVAFNLAVREARGRFFVPLDHDDGCVPEALERLNANWDAIPPDQQAAFCAVTALCVDQNGRLVGSEFPTSPTDSDSLEIRYRFDVKGEKWGFQRTDVLRRFPFPEPADYRGWVPEGIVWSAIARRFKTRYVNERLRVYWIEDTSLGRPRDPRANAVGRALEKEVALNSHIHWLRYAVRDFLISGVQYSRWSLHAEHGFRSQLRALTNGRARLVWMATLPLGVVTYTVDRSKLVKRLRAAVRRPHLARRMIARFLTATGVCRLFAMQRNGYRLRFYPTTLSATLWASPRDWDHHEQFFRDYLRPGDIVVDAGANVGTLALLSSSLVGENGRVYAVEAHPRTFTFLCGNVRFNAAENVTLFNVALGGSDGEITFSDKHDDDQNEVVTHGAGLVIPMRTLDSLPISGDGIALLKVDVEGYEQYLFQGAQSVLRRADCVFFECWEEHFARFGYRAQDAIDVLLDAGFAVFRLTKDESLVPLPRPYEAVLRENLVAIRDFKRFVDRTGYGIRETSTPYDPCAIAPGR